MNNGRQLGWGLGIVGLTATLAVGCSNQDRATAEENLHKWQTNGPKTYVYVDDTECFCVTRGPVRIVVTDDLVTSAVSQESGETVTTAKTMTELLQNVVADAGRDNASFQATYDPTLGYLKHLEVDRESNASDDEFSTTVTCLAEGSGDDVCPAP